MKQFIPVYQPNLSGNELKYVTECVTTNWISSQGKYVRKLEEEFADFCGVKHGIAVANGTVSLHLALLLADIGPGDEVIVPTLTFVAPANAVRYTGATPVFVDSCAKNWSMDPTLIEENITSRTRAIIPVHLYGHPVDMEPILRLAEKYDLYVVEDAAEAHGAEYKGRRVGSLGDIGSFSFYGNKIITTGEGGMLTTDDDQLAEKARFLRDHAMSKDKRYWHSMVGYNYRMTNLQAAVGVAQLEYINDIIHSKIQVAKWYDKNLKHSSAIVRPPQANWAKNVYWLYSILVTDDSPLNRDELIMALRERNIDARPFFYPMHQLPAHQEAKGSYPIADELSRQGLNLPSYPTLEYEQVQYICQTILELTSKQ